MCAVATEKEKLSYYVNLDNTSNILYGYWTIEINNEEGEAGGGEEREK